MVTNEDVCVKIQKAIEPLQDVGMKKRCEQDFPFIWSGQKHLARNNAVVEGRRQSRQSKKWVSNVEEWKALRDVKKGDNF